MVAGQPIWPVRFVRWVGARPSGVWVGTTGFGAVIVSAVGYFKHLDQAPTIAFLLIGSGLVFASPLIDRLEGPQKISGTGFEMNVLARSEREIESGQVVPISSSTDVSTHEPSDTEVERKIAGVVITQSAYNELNQLDQATRRLAMAALVTLGTVPIEEIAHVKILPTFGRDYYLYEIAPGVRLMLRQLDKTSPDESPRYAITRVLAAGSRGSSPTHSD